MAVLVERKHHVKKDHPEGRSSRERSIKILLNNEPMAVSQGTPENLAELAVGFLLAEGLISDREKLRDVETDLENAHVNVLSDEEVQVRNGVLHRVTSSGCAQSALLKEGPRVSVVDGSYPVTFKADDLLPMMEQLCFMSPKRNSGECVHGCGIGAHGKLLCVREDVGRHNAMDKLIGQAWLDGLVMHDVAMFTTGRISYEMAIKAIQSGVTTLVSHKSVTDSAIEVAEARGLTLVGKCRDNSLQVLSHHYRIV